MDYIIPKVFHGYYIETDQDGYFRIRNARDLLNDGTRRSVPQSLAVRFSDEDDARRAILTIVDGGFKD